MYEFLLLSFSQHICTLCHALCTLVLWWEGVRFCYLTVYFGRMFCCVARGGFLVRGGGGGVAGEPAGTHATTV